MTLPKAKKHWGQNFLVDASMQEKIVKLAHLKGNETVVEIGPGTGALTKRLCAQAHQVLAYEIDGSLVDSLQFELNVDNLHLIHGDVLKRNLDDDLITLDKTIEKAILVANLPYYITTPILFKVLEQSRLITTLILMMQDEVALRLTARKATKDYNALSVAIQYRTHVHYAFKVPKTVFRPMPQVDSAMLTLEVKDDRLLAEEDEPFFFDLIKQSFAQRRKTLSNNLVQNYPMDKESLKPFYQERNLPTDVRAEALSLEDFCALTQYVLRLWPH